LHMCMAVTTWSVLREDQEQLEAKLKELDPDHGSDGDASKTCEDCHLVAPTFVLPPSRSRRWCGECAKDHAGAVDVVPVVGGPHVNCCGRCETGTILGWMNKGQAVQKQLVPPRP
jgi:hypothetical protein